MARSSFVAVFASLSLLLACGDKEEPGGGGGGGKTKDLPAKILSFEATPSVLPVQGGKVTLSWKTEEALSGKLYANGEVVVDTLWPLSEGEYEDEIDQPTTYELVVVGEAGEDRKKVEVTLAEDVAVIVSFRAVPAEISRGEGTLLRWTTLNTDEVEIRNAAGESLDLMGAAAKEGAIAVRPLATTSYTLIATRNGESVQATTEVTVLPVELEIVSFAQAVPGGYLPGEEVELKWEVRGADTLRLSNLEGEEIDIGEDDLVHGSATMTMGAGARFRLVATQDDKTVEEELAVPILQPASIGFFVASPPAVTEPGGSTEVQWSGVRNAAKLTLERDPGEPVDVSANGLEEGSARVELDTDTTFTLVAWNRAGEDRKEVEIELVPPARFLSLTATPPRVGVGESFTLSWTSEDATHVEAETANGPLAGVSDFMVDADIELEIQEDTEFVIRLYNLARDFVEERLTVTVGAPLIESASLWPPFVGTDSPSSMLEWEVLGGNELIVEGPGGATVFSTTDPETIASGSFEITAPGEGDHEYTLVVKNGVSDITRETLKLTVGSGPFVAQFDAQPRKVLEGDSVLFSWMVIEDPAGAETTLQLTDGVNPFDISDKQVDQDSKSFELDSEGTYEFTLTASSANGARQETVEVQVIGTPTATLTSSAPEYDGITPVTLSWTSTNADGGLTLYRIAPGKPPVPILQVEEDERASGSFDVEPTDDMTYRIVADTGLGPTASAEVSVGIGPPVVVSFTASPQEVLRGEEVTLSWVTRLGQGVDIDVAPVVLESPAEVFGDPFQDISTTGTPVVFTQECGWEFHPIFGIVVYDADDEGCASVDFPDGFTFRLGSETQSSIGIYANGSLGFGPPYFLTTYANIAFPNAQAPIHIAPFWEDLINAEAWYEFDADADGQFLVVQWKGSIWGDPPTGIEVNFQAVLRDDGTLTYRYGTMTGANSSEQALANGASATIGYQWTDGSEWDHLHFGAEAFDVGVAMPGNLTNRSWYFPRDPSSLLATTGDFTFEPQDSQTVKLTVVGKYGTAEETIDVVVHEYAEVAAVLPTLDPSAGWPFELGWKTVHADMVEVLDDGDNVLCSVTTPEEVEEGSCAITEAAIGSYDYTIRAHGALGHTVDEPVTVQVFPTFLVEVFQADSELVPVGQEVTLNWITHGASAIEIEANGVDITPAAASPALGSVKHQPAGRTTYVLTILAPDGRSRTAEVTVDVKTVDLSVTVAPDAVGVGEPVTLSWNALPLDGGVPSVYMPMMQTLASYTDISTDPDAVLVQGADVDDELSVVLFADGFEFPFGGMLHDQVAVATNGFLSFDPQAHAEWVNLPFPAPTESQVHIAPFWDDLHSRESGRIHALAGEGMYIIQWSSFSRRTGSSNMTAVDPAVEYDMNFQVVLFEDGSFEFRYGAMLPPPVQHADCTQGDCLLDVQGASATVGYQNLESTYGDTFHFGGSFSAQDNEAFPGGFGGKAFRMNGTATGNMVLYPSETTTYEVCAELGDYLVCKEAEVEILP